MAKIKKSKSKNNLNVFNRQGLVLIFFPIKTPPPPPPFPHSLPSVEKYTGAGDRHN